MDREIEERFHNEMMHIYHSAANLKPPYRANLFLRMVQEHGGKEAANRLLATTEPSQGFAELYLRGKENLKLSVEYLVLQRPWCTLFTEDQLNTARDRLNKVECPLPEDDQVRENA
ncbi:hypothetical protein [Microbulbifer marinus]|uniref:Uncharacterized protein n=1 Tax=Microbulbifer marinus TaxID=658218 RepID=A0A1H4B1F1_9GAMM|nr:hypothetical protein [Microbulbifer marinus]SEA41916.1 hypothetical protein SAMN05216562_3031 [Microbulbifer marinus]